MRTKVFMAGLSVPALLSAVKKIGTKKIGTLFIALSIISASTMVYFYYRQILYARCESGKLFIERRYKPTARLDPLLRCWTTYTVYIATGEPFKPKGTIKTYACKEAYGWRRCREVWREER
jgi:hypothetical protein